MDIQGFGKQENCGQDSACCINSERGQQGYRTNDSSNEEIYQLVGSALMFSPWGRRLRLSAFTAGIFGPHRQLVYSKHITSIILQTTRFCKLYIRTHTYHPSLLAQHRPIVQTRSVSSIRAHADLHPTRSPTKKTFGNGRILYGGSTSLLVFSVAAGKDVFRQKDRE